MTELWRDARFYVWRGMDYRTGEITKCPEPGTSAPMGSDWQECRPGETADVVEVPYTVWGDYVGSTVERSNYRALVEDYPDTFVEIYGGYYSHVLYLPTFKLGVDGLKDAIRALFDYPLYNEEDHSMLEMDIAWEAWDGWLKSDVDMGLAERDVESDEWSDDDWEFVRQEYYQLTYDQNYGPECEDAVSAHFPFHDAVMDMLAEEIDRLGLEHDPRRPNPNQLQLKEEA